MCLIDKKKYRWTKEDIPIWKVVLKKEDGYYSPFKSYHKLMKVNEVVSEKLFSTLKTFIGNLINSHYYHEFGEGFFHAFTRYEDAVVLKNKIEYACDGFYTVIKGYIPKNTRYAISMYNPHEVCARKIILNI